MFVPAGSPIFFLREHRFAVRCRVVTLRQLLSTLFTLLFMLSMCLLHIFLYIFFINIECATLYHLSMMYVTVYDMSFNSNCRILAAELNYRFTLASHRSFNYDQQKLREAWEGAEAKISRAPQRPVHAAISAFRLQKSSKQFTESRNPRAQMFRSNGNNGTMLKQLF